MQSARREGGVIEWTHIHGRTHTRPTMTCAHCNRVTIIEVKARPDDCGGFCMCCMKPICKDCAGKPCTPFEKRLEEYEARMRLRRQMEI